MAGVPGELRAVAHRRLLQILQTREPYRLATVKRLAIRGPDRPAPKGRLIAQAVDECGRLLWPAGDELAAITLDGGPLLLPIGTDVEHEVGVLDLAQMNAPVVKNPLRMMR